MPFIGDDARRTRVLGILDQWQRRARGSRDEHEGQVRRDLGDLLRHAQVYSPFWADILASSPALKRLDSDAPRSEVLASLPILSRSRVIEAGPALHAVSPQMQATDLHTTTTSGSTSQPVKTLVHAPSYQPAYDAITVMDWLWHGRRTDVRTAAFRLGVPDADQVAVTAPMSYLGNFPPAVTREIKNMSVTQMLEVIREHRPAYLLVNPLSIDLMAREALTDGIKDLAMDQVITLADRVDKGLRSRVRRAFGAQIKDRYSCEEVGFIALQCSKHDWYHVVEPSVIVEVVDDAGQPCAVGQPGRVLVTSLVNPAMPLIRYELGDVAEWGPECDCGITWPVIRQIHGRVRQYVTTPDGRQVYATFIEAPFADMDVIREFRVVLHSDGLLFEYVAPAGLSEEQQEEIATFLRETFAYPWPVAFRDVTAISDRGQWKRREFEISEQPLPDDSRSVVR